MTIRLLILVVPLLAVAAFVALRRGEDEPADRGPGPTTAAREVLASRPEGQFTMCVQALRGAEHLQDQAMARLNEALAQVQRDKRWPRYFPSAQAPVVDVGCPQEPAVPRTNFVETPAYYRVFAFVVERAPFNALFPQESVRTETGAGIQQTAGMFVTPADLCDRDKLVLMLEDAVKFDHANQPPVGEGETPAPTATPCPGGG
jgi:hypothetical protein